MSSTFAADRAAAWLDVRDDVPGAILTALDGSTFSESALAHAEGLARASGSGLHLVTVLDPLRTGATTRTSAEARLQRVEALTSLERLAASLRARGHECTCELREGQPSVEIVGAAIERGIDLVALAARPRSERDRLTTGSVLHGIVASGLPSLLVARGRRGRPRTATRWEAVHRRIAVVVDGSRVCHRALRLAARLAKPHGAELVLVHVLASGPGHSVRAFEVGRGAGRREGAPTLSVPSAGAFSPGIPFRETSEAMRYLHVLEQTLAGAGIATRSRVFRSWACADAAHADVDLLVLSAGGVGDSRRGYGAEARRLLLQAEVPVLALRARTPAALAEPRAEPTVRSLRRASRRRREWSRSGPEGP